MRSYDFKHPKGTKYSADELRQHRDRWYEKVAAGGGLTPRAEHVEVDRQVFTSFQELVPYYPALEYLKDRNFAGHSFERAPFDSLFRYAYYGNRVEYEFLDPELESARGEFVSALRRFTALLAQNTWETHRSGFYTVPPEWEETQPERFERVVDEIHNAANALEEAYGMLIRSARRRLGIVGTIEPAPDA
jgi:hypothetical protein